MKLIESIIKELIKEGYQEETYYMFFQNIKQIHEQTKKIMEMNKTKVDEILKSGHDWAADHISTSKDDIEEVYNFLNSRCKETEQGFDQNGIMTENDLKKFKLINLGHEVFSNYMRLDKSVRSKIKTEWENEGLPRMVKFSGNNINRIISGNSNTKKMNISDMIDQLEILKDYLNNTNIDKLITGLNRNY